MQVITLNKETFRKRCAELISKIDSKPDIVIGILNGGGYIIDEIKNIKQFDSSRFELVLIQRKGTLKNFLFTKFLLNLMSYKILDKLRVYESNNAQKSIKYYDLNKLSNFNVNMDFTSFHKDSVKQILIIDDAVDTGKTMFIIENKLKRIFLNAQIKNAVIS